MKVSRIDLCEGKYSVIHDDGTDLHALRYGEPWRTMVGDNLILAMAQEIEELREKCRGLKNKNEVLEELRPHWAQGFSSDGVAAQTYLGALTSIYKALGVENQTSAMEKLRADEADAHEGQSRKGRIVWNEKRTVGIAVCFENDADNKQMAYELRKGSSNTLGLIRSSDFLEEWADMTHNDNCTIEEKDDL